MPIQGSAPNKTYVRSDGSRTGSSVCVQERDVAHLNNTAELADARENDFATGINAMLMKDGGNTPTANIPMGGYKLTGLAVGSTSGDSVEYAQWQASIPGSASESAAGVVELATSAEVQTGTDANRAITPAGLHACTATTSRAGVVELATSAETQTGTDTDRAVTPAGMQACTATTSRAGVVELATNAETQAGTDTARAVTPAGLASKTFPGAILAIIEDRKAAGTDGGGFTNGAWRTRTLNTLSYNRGTIATLASNEFTLPAGDYEIEWSAPAILVGNHTTRLYNVTSAAISEIGSCEYSNPAAPYAQTRSFGSTVVSLGSSTTFRIEHRCTDTVSLGGSGLAGDFGYSEIYARVIVRAA